ncbi:1-(5-phosphoribosyl)-5-[(5-phosphoribosylamino)methylideneamino]imidazole-4-carboxamide isomerase [Bizionia sediminis]|uniref:1-(5-phosphoribosyl)-5-[(5-phosphoribosylamino)methylideneamino] imidazole-4-carboxamide isomerase n=1 Tax=Bizionia sediminis TaxID=1737064 RepID=A0ABW5KQ68_9FLAO
MRIIPAIDIIGGKCVRLTKGNYSTTKVYNENPLEVAKQFEDAGIQYLHLVDLDGAKAMQVVNYRILELIASKTNLKIDFGGGLKSDDDLHVAFNSGARQITGGSIAVKDSDTFTRWLNTYGPEKIMLGADYYPSEAGGNIAVSGWQERSNHQFIPFVKAYQKKGIRYVVGTDISKDGMLQGPALHLYKKLLDACASSSTGQALKLIASGGVAAISDLEALKTIGCEGVIIGKALYENTIKLKDLERFI